LVCKKVEKEYQADLIEEFFVKYPIVKRWNSTNIRNCIQAKLKKSVFIGMIDDVKAIQSKSN
jgi:hypothetical protein